MQSKPPTAGMAVLGTAAMICAATVVCGPLDAVLGPLALTAGAVAAGTGIAIAADQCTSPKMATAAWPSSAPPSMSPPSPRGVGALGRTGKVVTEALDAGSTRRQKFRTIIYRCGGKSPSNFRLREGENAVSFRDSLSNPVSPGRPAVHPGKDNVGVDTSTLPLACGTRPHSRLRDHSARPRVCLCERS